MFTDSCLLMIIGDRWNKRRPFFFVGCGHAWKTDFMVHRWLNSGCGRADTGSDAIDHGRECHKECIDLGTHCAQTILSPWIP